MDSHASPTVASSTIPASSPCEIPDHAYGINKVGLERRGFTPEQLKELRVAYRLLTAGKMNVSQALEELRAAMLEKELRAWDAGAAAEFENRWAGRQERKEFGEVFEAR